MKKILSILAIMMVAVVGRVRADEIVWTEVSTAQAFMDAINNNHSANVKLTADINLGEVSHSDWEVFNFTFSGRLTGENAGGSDFTITSNLEDDGSMLFEKAEGATVSHLTLKNFKWQKDTGEKLGIVARESSGSTYDHITLENCSIVYDDPQFEFHAYTDEFGGLVGISKGDKYTYCTTAASCYFYGRTFDSDVNLGGLVGKAYNCTFTLCHNASSFKSYGEQTGGIAGYAEECTFDRCLNTGDLQGDEEHAGIVGNGMNCVIKRCVNTGYISTYSGKEKLAGIVGYLHGSSASILQCLNFGTVMKCDQKYGPLEGCAEDGAKGSTGTNSYYYCKVHGSHVDNESSYSDNSIFRISKMKSGEYAYKSTIDEKSGADKWLYQDIDNYTFGTQYPVPIPAAGVVYSNILCDGTQSYSNKYNSTEAHESQLDDNGVCTICGAAQSEHIKTAEDLVSFANAVNNGTDYSKTIVYLDGDIDLSGVTDFAPIGTEDNPFSGSFNGQSHRIKNMTLNVADGSVGLFGVVSGKSTTISNTIIDATCSVTSAGGTGIAGLVGAVKPHNDKAANVIIENCGNEAAVTGYKNVAGILGVVTNNDDNVITIRNCYNTGAVANTYSDNTYSASICGYAGKNYTIINCYNKGTLSGSHDSHYLYGASSSASASSSVSNSYDINGSQTGVTQISKYIILSGELCDKLNSSTTCFSQNVETQTYPVPGTVGKQGVFSIHISDADGMADFVAQVNDGNNCYNTDIYLENDIDISGVKAVSSGDAKNYLCGSTFSGNFKGQGHTLSNSKYPLFYRTSEATIENVTLEGFSVTSNQTSLIARTSYGTEFSHVTVKNSKITASENNNFGMIVGYSASDKIRYCTVESGCSITANRRKIGGIVGEMHDTSISYCRNSATISGDADYIGGIVGWSESSDGSAATIEYSLNTGTIYGDDECGGIAGQYNRGSIIRCVNTGTISSKDGDCHDHVAGIVGYIVHVNFDYNINFGPIVKAKKQTDDYVLYGGKEYGSVYKNAYYCDVKGKHLDSGISYDDIMSGKYAVTRNTEALYDPETWLYQDLDNGTFTATKYPVPLPEAGKVLSNILCDGTQSYSNKYNSKSSHTSDPDLNGICTICGNNVGTENMHIKTAAFLCEFASAVNSGRDFSNSTVYLDNDIDMSGVTDFALIGTLEHPYIGTFDGQGHRIMNLAVSRTENYAGLFGVVAGTNTVIKNIIMDATCSIASTASAAGGLVGGVTPTNSGLNTCNVTIQNCGNEASVTAVADAGGIIGGVYADDNSYLVVTDCYNTGTVKSTNNQAAALCGWARMHNTFTNCYNSGTVDGVDGSKYFYRYKPGGTTVVSNCYDVNGAQDDVKQITSDQVKSGELCFLLNGNKAAGTWGQTSVQSFPVLSGEGMQHYSRTMSNQWGTICLPFEVSADKNNDYDFYELSGVSDDALVLTKVDALEAGKPAIIRRNAEATGIDVNAVSGTTFAETPVAGSSADGLTITGAFATTEITDNDGYIISGNAFWNIADVKGENKVYCSPFHAYLAGTISSGARCLSIGMGETTGINDVLNGLNGENGLNGKFIVNGRLVIIRNGNEYNVKGQNIK